MVVSYWLVVLIVRDGGRIVLAGDVDCEGWWSYRTGW